MVRALTGLDVDDLSLSRGGRILFRNLSFGLGPGELLSLEGPNGAGKTSLLRAIAGFLEPHAGAIRLRTNDDGAATSGEERAGFVAWLGHQDGVKPQSTPAEVLGFFGNFYQTRPDVDGALGQAGLAPMRDLPVQYLSAGQKRRLALVRLTLTARPLWLLDEPLAALDAAGKSLAARFILAHCGAGGLVVAATHEPLGLDCKHLVLENRS